MNGISPRFERNLEALRQRHPEVAAAVDIVQVPVSTIVEKDGVAINLDLGGGMLYAEPEPDWSRARADELRDFPERIGFSSPNHCNFSDISLELNAELVGYLRKGRLAEHLAPLPVVDVGYVFVFGIGLGCHVLELVETTPARHIVLIEGVTEFLYQSLTVTDWERIFARAEERGIRFHFILSNDPENIASQIELIVSKESNVFLDGSFYYPHYYSWTFQEAFKLTKERIKAYYISSGFFEDELEMIRNCAANLKQCAFDIVEMGPSREQIVPVFIVGAGPSLDKDMDTIRKWRGRVVVISCGTVLGILLKNGIRPDLHCELERGEEVYSILSPLRQTYGFDGITLIATTTVDPRVSVLFDKRWFFFRSGLSTATLLRGSAGTLEGVDPLVCNAAFSAASTLGFREIYLFGIDLGQKASGQHHAKDSVYFENPEWDKIYSKRFDRMVPGNFGGTVETCWNFDIGRRLLARWQFRYKTKLYNCSDGAKIEGALPKSASQLAIRDGLPSPAMVINKIEGRLRSFGRGEILDEIDFDRHIQGCDTFIREFDTLLESARADGIGFFELERRLYEFVDEKSDDFRGFFMMGRGSIESMLRLGAFYGNRLPDEVERQSYFHHFLDCYRTKCVAMAETAKEILCSVRDHRDPERVQQVIEVA